MLLLVVVAVSCYLLGKDRTAKLVEWLLDVFWTLVKKGKKTVWFGKGKAAGVAKDVNHMASDIAKDVAKDINSIIH